MNLVLSFRWFCKPQATQLSNDESPQTTWSLLYSLIFGGSMVSTIRIWILRRMRRKSIPQVSLRTGFFFYPGTSDDVVRLEGKCDIISEVFYLLQDQCWFWHFSHSSELQKKQAGASNLRDHMPATAASNWFNYICLNSPRTSNQLKRSIGCTENSLFWCTMPLS